MPIHAYCRLLSKRKAITKTLRIMNLTAIILFTCCMGVNAAVFSQKINLSEKDVPFQKVLQEIERQSGYQFLFFDTDMKLARNVTIEAKGADLPEALQLCFKDQPLSYEIVARTVVVRQKGLAAGLEVRPVEPMITPDIHGRVTDSLGRPLAGASVTVKGMKKGTQTDANGEFVLKGVSGDVVLLISFTGYERKVYQVNGNNAIQVALRQSTDPLDKIEVVAYGTTTKRLSTGNVSTVTSEDLEKQPVTNVLSALSGRVPGLFIQTTNGLPGGNVSVSIRGKGSILAGTDPLYVIDGVPFASSVEDPNNNLAFASLNGAPSPFNSLNPADIESITVLKDADATAIYGSRGTNGVILITTKKGRVGDTKVDASFTEGINKISAYPKLQTPEQYLHLRRQAFANDGLTPSSDENSNSYAPDLTIWDTTKSTDWAKYYLGGTGHVSTAQLGISGGNAHTSFNVSGNYHTESTILPGHNFYQRGGLYFNLQHSSADNKFTLQTSASYTADKNLLIDPYMDLINDILLPPDYPIYDAAGNFNWGEGVNPVADQRATGRTSTDNLIANLSLKYTLLPGLNAKVSAGFNKININQIETFPTVSLYPGTVNYSYFGTNSNQSYIIEPQLSYDRKLGHVRMSLLAGGTYQDRITLGQTITAENYTNESLMQNLSSAGTVYPYNTYTLYKYISGFGRATLNWDDKYILNGTVRRDGSSRFGPGNQFGNFGSVGAAWLFSNEQWMKSNVSFLSYGKLRASYGLTGNDQISDYQYLSTYSSSSSFNYQDSSALRPSRIANADFHWETTKKLELAIELGFIRDRILLTVAHYHNASSDQLVNYTTPRITGFSYYEANLPAVVVNTGWELELNTKNIEGRHFTWTTTFNITIPRNELKSFQNFANSSYSQTLQLGYDITRIYGNRSLGVDPATGIASYAPQPGSSSTDPYYYFTIGKRTPDCYGGFGNTFTYKAWSLDVFGQFAIQKAVGGLTYLAGLMTNNYVIVNDAWTHPGEKTDMPKASTSFNDFYYTSSNANYFNASYFRVKNIALYYRIPAARLKRAKMSQLSLFVQGQNLFTFWNRNVPLMDPESGAMTFGAANFPPMKTFTAGVQLSF